MASETVWVMNARIAFAKGLFNKEPPANDPKGKARYGVSLILEPGHPDLKKLEELQEQLVLDTEFKDKSKPADVYKELSKKDKLAVHDGDDKKKFEGFEGNFYIAPSADTRPTAINRDRSPVTEEDGVIYSGCYVNAKIELWVQDNQWGKRVNATLLGIQFVKDGDSFAGGPPPANPDDFPDLDAGEGGDDNLFG